ncbi:hypothetical protein AWB73_01757 [Caballeronia turbans]|nr:hypothetical protein AWB73_01757 [Caballeronia turbans]
MCLRGTSQPDAGSACTAGPFFAKQCNSRHIPRQSGAAMRRVNEDADDRAQHPAKRARAGSDGPVRRDFTASRETMAKQVRPLCSILHSSPDLMSGAYIILQRKFPHVCEVAHIRAWRDFRCGVRATCPHRRLDDTTSAMPPSIATALAARRAVSGSPSNSTPPAAAITGTLSCTVAAVAGFKPFNAAYQMT